MKKTLVNGGLFIFSLLIALLIGELMCRLFLDPADYLSVNLVDEPVLNHHIAPGSPGYDEWGFRNDSVPDKVDVVAIGDSQTFGINATKEKSWPKSLGHLMDKEVYNMGLGSYGVVQYYHLFKTKALSLDPEQIIIGFYMGNDLMDSYYMTYYNRHWKHLQDHALANTIDRSGSDIIDYYLQQDPDAKEENQRFGKLRSFLSHNSLLYRIVVHGPILGSLKRKFELMYKENQNGDFARLYLPDRDIDEGFRPTHRANKMDLKNIRVREGLRISLLLIKEMHEISEERDIKFTVLLIPTKEAVFGEQLATTPQINHYDDIQRLLSSEQLIAKRSKAYFDSLGIAYIDPLPELRVAVGREKIYPENYDDHPNERGYEIIAHSIGEYLKSPITKK